MKAFNRKFRLGILQELLILFLFVLLLNNFLGRRSPIIVADGKGYYDYLPALIIYNDLNFNYTDTLVTEFYDHKAYNQGINPSINGHKINKYFVGTALAQLPFFLMAHGIAVLSPSYPPDGYSLIYQDFVTYAAFFYLVLGLFFIRKLLRLKGLLVHWIFALQLVVLFASSLMQYAHADASFSHIYSFFFVAFFVYCLSRFAHHPRNKYLYLAGLAFGFIVLIRPANGLLLLFVPFLFDDFNHFSGQVRSLFGKHFVPLLLSVFLVLLLVAIQPMIWFVQTGLFYVKPYQEETFILSQPNMLKFLFSYQKGFFVYAPAFFVMLVAGTVSYMRQRAFWKLISFYTAFFVLVYVLSSWWVWYYGGSYGSRVMVDYYALFVLFAAPAFLAKSRTLTWGLALLLLCFSYYNIIQTHQYQAYILHMDSMNKQGFWQVFLKTHPKYRGLYYQPKIQLDQNKLIFEKQYAVNELVIEQMGSNYLDAVYIGKFDSQAPLVVALDMEVNYHLGVDQILLVAADSVGNKTFTHSQHLFKGNGQTNFSGNTCLLYKLEAAALDQALLNIYFIREEKDTRIEEFTLKVYAQ
jgi:hypothetical protein